MLKLIFTLCFTSFFIGYSSGQTVTVSGTVNDPVENKYVQNVVIALLNPTDSVLYKFTRTDVNGKYIIKNIVPGKYILMTTHPLFADVAEDIQITENTDFRTLSLVSKAKLLQEVIIKTGSPIKIKGDTTVYTADSFKVSANANVEELLKKLPGIQVDKNGTIKAMGETVSKVLVDGEEFFGDDPGMAVKNLRADAVKEVQVFNKKSDQAEFTGIDDGNTQKTINLKLKEDKKRGYFGKFDAAAGPSSNTDARYNNNLLFSSFKGKRKLSGFLLNGNTGQDGLSWQDEQKFGGNDNVSMSMDDDGGVMYMWSGGSSDEEPYLNPQNGIITNVNAGVQYSDKWNDKTSLNFSPKYNRQNYINNKQIFRQTQIGDSVINENTNNSVSINRYNVKLRGTYEVKLDSFNTFKITANANFYNTRSEDLRNTQSTGKFGTFKNLSNRLLTTRNEKSAYTGNMIFKHKFKKERRTISLSADWNSLSTEGENFLRSFNQAYFNGMPASEQTLDQMKEYEKLTNNISSSVVYTEPLSKKMSLETGYKVVYSHGTNEQTTFNYTAGSGKYDLIVDSLSNRFRQNIIQHIPSTKINYSTKKLKINAGAGVGITEFQLQDITYNKDYNRNFINFFPSGNINYTYKPSHNLRFNYNGNTTQPTINQLQPLRNNNDFFNQYIGNPNLRPSFTNTFNISHNSYNFLKDLWTYQSLNIRAISNSITQNRIINIDSGTTISQPINTQGNLSINFWSGFGFKVKNIDTRFNLNPNFGYSRFADVINSRTSFTRNLNAGLSVQVSKSKEKKYDLSLENNFTYNSNTTSQNDTKIRFSSNRFSANTTVYFNKVWSVINNYDFYWREKTLQFGTNINNHLWNARLQRNFKNDEFSVYISVRDILNQNVGLDRSFNSNTFTEERNDRLRRYFLLGFTWNFKNKAAQPAK